MKTGKASQTALRVAIRRAAHQLVDPPPVLDDPIALRIVGPGHQRDLERACHTVARDFRGFLSARSRFTEDRLAQAFVSGIRQYVLLGAGLDTFAYRNPFDQLRVFELDFPATQAWKQQLLFRARIGQPENLTFVPCDFERKTLPEALHNSGFDLAAPACFAWLGVVPYLTREAFHSTLSALGRMAPGSLLCFDYNFAPEALTPTRRVIFERLSNRLSAAGEPFRLFFTPEQIHEELQRAGFSRVEQTSPAQLNQLYFDHRADGLRLSDERQGRIVTAWL